MRLESFERRVSMVFTFTTVTDVMVAISKYACRKAGETFDIGFGD